MLHSTWNLPGPGIETVYTALVGKFLSTVPPGKSRKVVIFHKTPITHRPATQEKKHSIRTLPQDAQLGNKRIEGLGLGRG